MVCGTIKIHKRITQFIRIFISKIRCRAYCVTVSLGDKEIAVRIRNNSHYRIFVCFFKNDQVGMLIVL